MGTSSGSCLEAGGLQLGALARSSVHALLGGNDAKYKSHPWASPSSLMGSLASPTSPRNHMAGRGGGVLPMK